VIPDENAALLLHKKYGSDDRIVKHCQTVASVARLLAKALAAKNVDVDERAIVGGALLHDIGRTRTQTVQHGYVGAELLRAEGVDEVVVETVKKHVGAGISEEEANALGFPPGDYIPRTLEEKVVCFADKMVSSNTVRPFEEEVKRFVRKGHDVERLERLKSDLAEELGEDPERVVQDGPALRP
jgi:uncharacterized protein (TIGR00295 family)